MKRKLLPIGEKIKALIKQAGHNKPGTFYKVIHTLYGKNAIDLKTYYNLLHACSPREKTLQQISGALKITISDLCSGTDREIRYEGPVPGQPHITAHTFNSKATIFSYQVKAPFLPLRLHLKAGGQTSEEHDSPDTAESVKLVWVIVGKIAVVIKTKAGEERRELHNGQVTTFDARQRHYYINRSKTNSIAHIIHYPSKNVISEPS